MTEREVEKKVRELRQLQNLIEEAQEEAETIKDALKAFMGDSSELRAGEYEVAWKPVESVRIDARALKREMPELYERYSRKSTVRRFCVA